MSEPAQEYNKALNRLLMRVTRRAEKSTAEYLTRTFVPVEPVPSLLESSDNQVVYGRRGTGKTHLLKYIAESKKRDGDIALYIDLRTIGSSGGLYADLSQPLALRATHLLVDLVEELHNQVRDLVENTATFDDVLDALIPSLDDLGTAASEVRVVATTRLPGTSRAGALRIGRTHRHAHREAARRDHGGSRRGTPVAPRLVIPAGSHLAHASAARWLRIRRRRGAPDR